MLPFDSQPQVFTIRKTTMPRYGCLTVQETILFDQLLAEHQDLIDSQSPDAALDFFMPIAATLILISRDSPTWSIATAKNYFTPGELVDIADFALGERRRWKDPIAGPVTSNASQSKRGTDWAEVYWLLKLHYPYEESFCRSNFGSCPVLLVEQAIAASTRLEIERAHRAATPISLLGYYALSGQGVEAQTSQFNPYEKMLNQRQALQSIDRAIAATVINLLDKGQLPSWVIPLIPIDKMRLAANA